MALGALVDAGLSMEVLGDAIAQMGVSGVSLECEQAQRGGLTGTFVRVNLDAEAERTRNFGDFIEIVESSTLSNRVKEQSTAVFRRMEQAEARVHRTSADDVHLHELGTLDTLGRCRLRRGGFGSIGSGARILVSFPDGRRCVQERARGSTGAVSRNFRAVHHGGCAACSSPRQPHLDGRDGYADRRRHHHDAGGVSPA